MSESIVVRPYAGHIRVAGIVLLAIGVMFALGGVYAAMARSAAGEMRDDDWGLVIGCIVLGLAGIIYGATRLRVIIIQPQAGLLEDRLLGVPLFPVRRAILSNFDGLVVFPYVVSVKRGSSYRQVDRFKVMLTGEGYRLTVSDGYGDEKAAESYRSQLAKRLGPPFSLDA